MLYRGVQTVSLLGWAGSQEGCPLDLKARWVIPMLGQRSHCGLHEAGLVPGAEFSLDFRSGGAQPGLNPFKVVRLKPHGYYWDERTLRTSMNDETAWPNPLQLLESGYDIKTIQELPGHQEVRTTMIYPHVLNWGGKRVKSPEDDLCWRKP